MILAWVVTSGKISEHRPTSKIDDDVPLTLNEYSAPSLSVTRQFSARCFGKALIFLHNSSNTVGIGSIQRTSSPYRAYTLRSSPACAPTWTTPFTRERCQYIG